MATPPTNDSPLRELKHEAVPGYFRAFSIAFAVMGVYLAIILITSPGPAKGHSKPSTSAEKAEPGNSH